MRLNTLIQAFKAQDFLMHPSHAQHFSFIAMETRNLLLLQLFFLYFSFFAIVTQENGDCKSSFFSSTFSLATNQRRCCNSSTLVLLLLFDCVWRKEISSQRIWNYVSSRSGKQWNFYNIAVVRPFETQLLSFEEKNCSTILRLVVVLILKLLF